MAWYVETLLRNSLEIKARADLNADDYNDLIVLQKKIDGLHNENIISDEEMLLIDYIEDGKPMVNSKRDFGKNRLSVSKDINKLCDKIAFYIGGYFTDDGYIHHMTTTYKLSPEQVDTLSTYMKSRYKNKIIRKTKKSDE